MILRNSLFLALYISLTIKVMKPIDLDMEEQSVDFHNLEP